MYVSDRSHKTVTERRLDQVVRLQVFLGSRSRFQVKFLFPPLPGYIGNEHDRSEPNYYLLGVESFYVSMGRILSNCIHSFAGQ